MSELPSIYESGDITYYRASSLGRCMRAMVAQRLGFEPLAYSDKTEGYFAEGHLHEPDIINRLIKLGYQVETSAGQDEVTVMVGPKLGIRGHIDGICLNDHGERRWVIECKAMGQSMYDKVMRAGVEPFLKTDLRYGYQISAYMMATKLQALYAIKNRNTGEMTVEQLVDPPVKPGIVKARVLLAEKLAKQYQETGEFPSCDTNDYPCPFVYLHDEKEEVEGVEPDAEVEALAEAYARARDRVEEAERVKNDCRARILATLGDRPKVKSAKWSVAKSVAKRKKLDLPRLKEAIDVAPFEVEYEVVSLRVMDLEAEREKKRLEKEAANAGI